MLVPVPDSGSVTVQKHGGTRGRASTVLEGREAELRLGNILPSQHQNSGQHARGEGLAAPRAYKSITLTVCPPKQPWPLNGCGSGLTVWEVSWEPWHVAKPSLSLSLSAFRVLTIETFCLPKKGAGSSQQPDCGGKLCPNHEASPAAGATRCVGSRPPRLR